MRRLPGLVVLALRRDQAKDAGILIFRHENAVLRPPRCWTGAQKHDTSAHRPPADPGTCQIRRKPILSGPINEYERAA
jgi:hypothetical protein